MKNILLSSVAVFAFAGAAFADVTVNGDAEIGFNDEIEGGLYWVVGATLGYSTDIGAGWTAAGKIDVDFTETSAFGLGSIDASDWVLSITSDMGGLYFGDTAVAADAFWSGVTNMNDDGFAENGDGNGDPTPPNTLPDEDAVLRLEYTGNNYSVGFSGIELGGAVDRLSFGAKADLGSVSLVVAYQDADNVGGEIIGVSAGMTVGNIDLMVAYADATAANSSIGFSAGTTFGMIAVGGFYVIEDAEDDNYGVTVAYADGPLSIDAFYHGGSDDDVGINVAYEVSSDMSVFVGHSEDDGSYIGVEYALSDSATFTASYGDDTNNATNDEIGPQEYLTGLNLNLALSF